MKVTHTGLQYSKISLERKNGVITMSATPGHDTISIHENDVEVVCGMLMDFVKGKRDEDTDFDKLMKGMRKRLDIMESEFKAKQCKCS